jgi:hypothetical protein
MIYGRGRPIGLPFVGARATCPYNKINIKSIFYNYHSREFLGKLLFYDIIYL